MRRKITVFIIIGVCYLLQTTFFDTLSFASISPNLLIIVTSSFGFMRGRKEGLFIGFFCGLLLDIFGGGVLGFYSLLYMYIGYINGMFRKLFYPEDIKLPLVLIAGSDLSYNQPRFKKHTACFFYIIKQICLHSFSRLLPVSGLSLKL